MIDRGTGFPLVLIPGIQGRWQLMAPAIDALSARFRVLSFSLGDADTGRGGFDAWIAHIDAILDRAAVARAVIVGVSFGGVIAARYAARRPDRVAALVLVASPSPRWRPTDEAAREIAHPWRSAPGFALRAVGRLLPETAHAMPR